MPNFPITVSGFTGAFAALNGSRNVTVSETQWLLSAVSVGTPMLRTSTPLPMHAAAFALYRAMAAKVAVDFSGAAIARPATYRSLDPTEKANISFWTGMTVANLLADRLLNVPALIHAASLKAAGGLTLTNPASRVLADLVGTDLAGGWHCIEAKARQSKPTATNRTHWKNQALSIGSIGGAAPASRSYVAVTVGATYRAEMVDPPGDGGDVLITQEGLHGYLATYYRGFIEFVESGQDRQFFNQTYRLKLAGYDVQSSVFYFLGLDRQVFDAGGLQPIGVARSFEEDNFTVASNGVCLVTSDRPVL